jgi:hypothetical protein
VIEAYTDEERKAMTVAAEGIPGVRRVEDHGRTSAAALRWHKGRVGKPTGDVQRIIEDRWQ